ncbi:MAG: thiamine phosphate synthase [Planctomycetota bacterium]
MHEAFRIIDANANRAREAARVLEDTARFGLDNAELSGSAKALRHDLRAAIDGLGIPRDALIASRDTPGDVGTALSTDAEGGRVGLRGVAAAAASRLTEALRAIEESAKLLGPGAAAIEAIRYRAYELERRLDAALVRSACRWRLCVLITQELCRAHAWHEVARRAVAGGADCLQLREKSLDGRELVSRARRLVELAGGRAAVVVNDRVDVALAAAADGVHLGQGDLSVGDARRIGGDGLLVGVSASTVEQARDAVRDGADSLGVGAMFETRTKIKPSTAGPELLHAVAADPVAGSVPRLAIGGITAENAGVLGAGGHGVAVSSAVCGSADPEAGCRSIIDALG